MLEVSKALGLFIATALFEIVGCFLPLQWLSGKGSPWLLILAGLSLAVFVWLLSLHPTASGRVYATYGGVYVATAMVWLWLTDGVRPQLTDFVGAALTLTGAATIALGYRGA